MTTKTDDIKLPPLPYPQIPGNDYTASDMHAYAIAAVETDRQGRFDTGEALRRYLDCGGDEEPDPIERLRFYCSLTMSGQDWLDVEQLFDEVVDDRKRRGEPVKVPSDADAKYVQDFINCDGMGAMIVEGPQYSAVVRALLDRYGQPGHLRDATKMMPGQPAKPSNSGELPLSINPASVSSNPAAPVAQEPVAWLRSDELRKLGRPGSDAPLNERSGSQMLHAKGTPEAAAKYGFDVPVFRIPVAAQPSAQDREDAESILLGQILSDWHNRGETGDVDGGWLQEIVVKSGLATLNDEGYVLTQRAMELIGMADAARKEQP